MSTYEERKAARSVGDLPACPACGGDLVDDQEIAGANGCTLAVLCTTDGCGMQGPERKTWEEACEAWNALPRTPADDTFTVGQLAYLKDLLTVRCCHVTGTHDPRHFAKRTYVCRIQEGDAFVRARNALGFGEMSPADALSDPDCVFCNRRLLGKGD